MADRAGQQLGNYRLIRMLGEGGFKVKVWSIGKPQIVAMIVGIILLAGLSYILEPDLNSASISGPSLTTETLLLEILPLLTILFFGIIFGPWVGCVSGGISVFLVFFLFPSLNYYYDGYLGYFYIHFFFTSYNDYLSYIVLRGVGFALIGFIAGLAFVITKGHYNNFRAMVTEIGISIFATLFGLGLAFAVYHGGGFYFIDFLLPISACLIPLPILLIIYNAITSRLKRA